MIRKLVLAATVALGTSLGGCATTGGSFDLSSFIVQVQGITNAVCQFIPTAETVAGIVATGNPIVATATAVANAICDAVKPKTASRLRGTIPTVAGVVIHGRFTGPRK